MNLYLEFSPLAVDVNLNSAEAIDKEGNHFMILLNMTREEGEVDLFPSACLNNTRLGTHAQVGGGVVEAVNTGDKRCYYRNKV